MVAWGLTTKDLSYLGYKLKCLPEPTVYPNTTVVLTMHTYVSIHNTGWWDCLTPGRKPQSEVSTFISMRWTNVDELP